MKLVKFLAASLAAVAMLAACESAEENKGNGNNNDGQGGIIVQEFVTVYCDVTAAGWETCSVWAWNLDDNSINYTGGTWPGEALTETEEIDGVKYYIWNCPKETVGTTIGFILNEGVDGGAQTIDIHLPVADGVKVAVIEHPEEDGKWSATIDGVEFDEPEKPVVEEPKSLEGHSWGVIGAFNSWSADVAMTVEGNTATATFEVAAIDGENGHFKVRADAGWDISYGVKMAAAEAATFAEGDDAATEGDTTEGEETPEDEGLTVIPTDGTPFPATFNGSNIVVEEVGTYTITLTITEEASTFTLTKN